MTATRLGLGWSAFWGRRVAQWCIVAGVVLSVLYVLGRKAEEVQSLAELAAVQSSLAALRTALIVDHLRQQAQRLPSPHSSERNPFLLLGRVPPNYGGVRPMEQGVLAPPGSWFYDPACICIGYHLLQPQELTQPATTAVMGWRVEGEANTVLTLRPLASYRWLGQAIY